MNKTTISAKAQDIIRKWYVIDAKDQVLGDVAVHAANLLRGKTKPIFTPHVDTGDFVVIINAKDVVVTGNKESFTCACVSVEPDQPISGSICRAAAGSRSKSQSFVRACPDCIAVFAGR